jgi:hypothetical protein
MALQLRTPLASHVVAYVLQGSAVPVGVQAAPAVQFGGAVVQMPATAAQGAGLTKQPEVPDP